MYLFLEWQPNNFPQKKQLYTTVWLGRQGILDNRAIVLASLIIRVKHFHHVEGLTNLLNQPCKIQFERRLTFRIIHILSHLLDDQTLSFI